jgi:4-diphosphocytidyl-2-C-methyl-D-erythritol kinase
MTIEMRAMQVSAPAKINLSLRVLGKRNDGFHEIETCIAPISLADTITIKRQTRWIDLHCDDPSIPPGDENLVVRAAKAFFESTKQKGGVAIELKKQIPHGAGLGGGSSDAASALLALNELFGTKLSQDELCKIGATIGSDVPFFLFRSAAICRGRGEVVSPTRLSRKLTLLLLKPDFGVPAAWAYSRWNESREIPGVSYKDQEFGSQTFVNDLECPVFEKFVFLAELKMWLLKQAEVRAALMSGSGSTIFAVLKDARTGTALADRARKDLDPEVWTWVGETL